MQKHHFLEQLEAALAEPKIGFAKVEELLLKFTNFDATNRNDFLDACASDFDEVKLWVIFNYNGDEFIY